MAKNLIDLGLGGPDEDQAEDTPQGIEALARVLENDQRLIQMEETNRLLVQQLVEATKEKSSRPPPENDSGLSSVLALLTDVLRDQKDGLPKKEPDIFRGDIFMFPVWLNSYRVLVEDRCPSYADRNYYLSKYTAGEAKQSIEGMLALNTSTAYDKAMATLQRRYGDKRRLSKAFREKLDRWPVIKAGDGKSLMDFSDFLNQCEAGMATLGGLCVLDDAVEQERVLDKLPTTISDRWYVIVDKALYGDDEDEVSLSDGEYPRFKKLCGFLTKQARIACNKPASKSNTSTQFSASSGTGGSKTVQSTKTPAKTSVTAFASTSSDAASASGGTKPPEDTHVPSQTHRVPTFGKCVLCSGNHSVDFCQEFSKMSLKDRVGVVMKHGLCKGCFKWGHRICDCRHKRKCERCGRMHPTLLHDDALFKPTEHVESAVSHRTESSVSDCESHSLIVPVMVHHADNPDNRSIVYALLDEQSDACFAVDSVLRRIGASGESVSLRLSTVLAEDVVACTKVNGLVVRGLNETSEVSLPPVYSRDSIPAKRSQIPRPDTACKWSHLVSVANQLTPHLCDVEVGLLVGMNCAKAIRPLEVVAAGENDPYGVKTALGWGVVGRMSAHSSSDDTEAMNSHFAFKTQAKEVSPAQVAQMFEQDFSECGQGSGISEGAMSVEDRRFLDIVHAGMRQREDGHFEVPLPFRQDGLRLPNNKEAVEARLKRLRGRLGKDPEYKKAYCEFMSKLIEGEYAERVPEDESSLDDGTVWYIPHHGVFHPRKPGKLRVVFDCAAQFHGEALNKHVLRGPDLLNSLTGILVRFRRERVAFTCDVEAMFHQVVVPPTQRNLLRFLWWTDGDLSRPPTEMRMTRHCFGLTSSPGCCNVAIRATADKFRGEYGDAAADFILRDFYVDDGLKSTPSPSEAADLIRDSRLLCERGGFNLRAYTCNDRDVVETIPEECRAKEFQQIDLHHDALPVERTLGIVWSVQSDEFHFRVDLKDRPMTRRGLLSTVSAVFDPLGLISPFLLKGKKILQGLCVDGSSWDDPLPDEVKQEWEQWRSDLLKLSMVKVPRCYKTEDLGTVVNMELHHFSDASLEGYGQCSYLRLTDEGGKSEVSLVMAKSRVAPAKSITVPRLELTAALTSARVGVFLGNEIGYENIEHFYYTDSQVVLGYISNESRKFHIFVANRVQQIRDSTSPENWRYIRTDLNPADLASRGMSVEQLQASSLWWKGPPFLVSGEIPARKEHSLPIQDPEVKTVTVFKTGVDATIEGGIEGFEQFSSWFKLKRAVALCIKFVTKLRAKDHGHYTPVTTEDLQKAEDKIIQMVQAQAYSTEIRALKKSAAEGHQKVNRDSKVLSLEPFLDGESILRVGGRLRRSSMPESAKHPILLPRDSHVSQLIIAHHHRLVNHAGRGMTLNSIRQRYWIVGARTAVTLHIMNCVMCRRLRGTPCNQRMADLPADRLEPTAPFTHSAVDYFGPFLVKQGRSDVKRWGVLFTCLSSRAVHLETANELTTDSFLNAYRRFVCRRGSVRLLRCDRGTNFVGGRNELAAALSEMDNDKIRRELLKDECDWVRFEMNFPNASHMGGAWERMIGSARKVLTAILTQNGRQLDDELLRTLLAETEYIINSRPLTVVDTTSPDLEPLSPSQILMLKSQVVKPPPGNFVQQDLYCRKRWRRVQFLSNQFWTRWRTEFLSALQPRPKWRHDQRNLKVNDVVLLVDDGLARCQWPLARVTRVFPSEDQLVRKVEILIGKTKTVLERPVHKLILLVAREDPAE